MPPSGERSKAVMVGIIDALLARGGDAFVRYPLQLVERTARFSTGAAKFFGAGGPRAGRPGLEQGRDNGVAVGRIVRESPAIPGVMADGAGDEVGGGPDGKAQRRKIPAHQRKASPLDDL